MTTTNLPNILVTGATGNTGFELAKALSAQGIPFRAMVRNKTQAALLAQLPGATLVDGDFNHPESLAAALAGIDKAFLVTPSSENAEKQQKDFVDAAKAASVQHIVKLSQWAASAGSPVRFLRYHAAVEAHIKAGGLAYTFLRPNLFMQGLLGLKDYIISKGIFFAAVGDAPISMVDVRDIAAVAAAALTGTGHHNKTYNLTGPEALTHYEVADQLSTTLGRTIHFADTSDEVMYDALIKAGFPEWQAAGLIEDYAHYRNYEATEITGDITHITGQAPRPFTQFAVDYAPAFSLQAVPVLH